jgi:hypothetical protein
MWPSSRVALAAIALLLAPAAAVAETDSVDVARWRGDGQLFGPILTADGDAVFGVQRSRGAVDVLRVAPGATQPEKVASVALPAKPTPAWNGVRVTLTPAGEGFFLYQDRVGNTVPYGPERTCCSSHDFAPKLTWFATPSAAGADVSLCAGGACADCGNVASPTIALAGNATHALIISRCPYRDGTGRGPFVEELATGADHPLAYPAHTQGDRLAGRYVSYWGSYDDTTFTNAGRVIDWQTGSTVRTIERMGPHALLADATVIYNSIDDTKVRRWDASAAAPVELAQVRGVVQTATGGRLLTLENESASQRAANVWTLTGEPVSSLPLPESFNAVGFDGQRAAFFDPACSIARLQIWEVGTAPPSRLSPVCGPVTVGSVQMAQGRARAEVGCPARVVQGCVGFVLLRSPRPAHPRHAGFWLQAGQRRWVPLATRLSPQRCRALARTRTWRLRVSFNSVYGQQERTVRRRPAVAC